MESLDLFNYFGADFGESIVRELEKRTLKRNGNERRSEKGMDLSESGQTDGGSEIGGRKEK